MKTNSIVLVSVVRLGILFAMLTAEILTGSFCLGQILERSKPVSVQAVQSQAAQSQSAQSDNLDVKSLWTRTRGDDWPSFLGIKGQSSSRETGILKDWSAGKLRMLWKRETGAGYGMAESISTESRDSFTASTRSMVNQFGMST